MFVKTNGKKIEQYPYELAHIQRDHDGVIFSGKGPSHSFMELHGIHVVYEDVQPVPEREGIKSNAPTYNDTTHYIVKDEKPKLVDGRWTLQWKVKKKSKKMMDSTKSKLATIAIRERNNLLNESDWVVIRSMERGEEVPAGWRNYRENLRDIEEQKGFPLNIAWPVSP